MGRANGDQAGSTCGFLILIALLVTSLANSTEQHDVVTPPNDTRGCTVSPAIHFSSPDDAHPARVNTKNLKCNNVSIAVVNREYFKSGEDVTYKEIILKFMQADEHLNVINEQQTEILELVDSDATDGQLQKIFQNKSFIRLRTLDLSGNRIANLERDMFRKSNRLQTVNLGRNEINEIKGEVFADLLDLNELYLNHNNLVDFSSGPEIFNNLKRLTVLDLSNNTIVNIGRSVLYSLENLVEINMSYNKLYILPYQVFESMKLIEAIDLSHNLLISFLDNFFIHNHRLKVLKLEHNLMGRINKNLLYGLKGLHTLDLSFNQLLTVDRNAFDTLDGLNFLNLANNPIHLLSANVFLSLKQLKSLDLSNHEMAQLPLGIFAHQFQLNELKMDNTNLVNASNWISKTNVNSTINKNVLSNLKFVSLKNSTKLRNVESCVLQNMPSVERFYITNSQLTFLPDGIEEMPNLIELDLSNNRIEFIPQGIKDLNDLTSLNLLGNDLQCDCHMYWMLNWIDELKIKNKTLPSELLRLSEMKCRNGYPGDIIRVLQHINCVKPHLISATQEQTYPLFTDAILECSFAGNPAPEIVWRTPHGEILRHEEGKVDLTAKFQLKQLHQSVLKDTPENLKLQQIIDSAMKNESIGNRVRQGPGITLLENGTLTVHNISRLESGLYSCFAVNIMGNSTTDVR